MAQVSAAFLLLVLLALCALPVLLRRPEFAVLLFTFLLVLHANLILSKRFSVHLADPVIFGMMLGLVAVYPILHGDRPNGSGRFFGALAIWLAAVLNSLLWSGAYGVSLVDLQAFLPNILYALLLFLLVTDRDRLLAALAGVLAACLVLSVLTIIQLASGLQDFDFYGLANGSIGHIAGGVDALRPTGPVYDPNYYCQILIPGFGIALAAAAGAASPRMKSAGFAAAVVIGIAMLLTASRGGLVAAGVSVLFVLYAYKRIRYLVFLLPPLVATLYLVPAYSDRLVSMVNSAAAFLSGETVAETSLAGRLAEMEAAAILFSEQPLYGIGYGMFETRYQDISANYDLQLRGQDRSAHSLYLETAAEQGVIGLFALLVLLCSSLRALQLALASAAAGGDVRLMKGLNALGAASAGLLASSLFLHDAYAQHFWLVLALLFATERVGQSLTEPLNRRVMLNV